MNYAPDQIDELTQFLVLFLFFFEIGAFFFWMFRQSIFNLEKEYGEQKHFFKRNVLEIIIYAFCIFIIFSPSVVIPLSAMYKISYELGINKNTSCTTENFVSQLTTYRDVPRYYNSANEIERERERIAVKTCSDIQYFVTGVDSYDEDKVSERLPYDVYMFIQIFFISTIGIPVLIVQKYGDWRVVAWMSLYTFILSAFITPFLIIFDTLSVYIPDLDFGKISLDGTNGNFFVIILAIAFLIFFQSIRIFKRNSYSLILVVNCGILTSLLNLLLLGILIAHEDYQDPAHFLPYFLGFLVIYACLFSFQKKMLLRNFSLPKRS